MRRSVALLLVVGVFVAGAIVGVVGTHLVYAERFTRPGSIAEAAVDFGGRRVARELDLRPAQEAELERILADVRVEIDDVRRDAVLRLRTIRDDAADRLVVVLDEEQKARLDAIHREQGRLFDEYLE